MRNQVKLTNLDKVYFPKDGFTKGDLIHYYETMAPFILPYLQDRPIVMRRYPSGIEEENFFQKDLEAHPSFVKTIPIKHENRVVHYIIIENLETLLYVVNLGTIEIHTMNVTVSALQKPTYSVIDLDPIDVPFDEVIEVALVIHDILNSARVPNYCKTSGSKGLHIYIPLGAQYTIEQSLRLSQLIAHLTQAKLPKLISLERAIEKRQARVYIDFLQNRKWVTMACPYSVRARKAAPVSFPLAWQEVKRGLKPEDFTIKTVPQKVKEHGDPFTPVLGPGVVLRDALKILESQFLLSK